MPRRAISEDYKKSNLYLKVTGRHFPIPGRAGPREVDECSKFTAFFRFLI
jgi:hypothetical protein